MNQQFQLSLQLYRRNMRQTDRTKSYKRKSKNAYPFAIERGYAAWISQFMKGLTDYVEQTFTGERDAIMRGDAAEIVVDAAIGKAFRRFIDNLNGWVALNFPNKDDPTFTKAPVMFLGLDKWTGKVKDFADILWGKETTANIGVPWQGGDWWPDTKEHWADTNYNLIKSLSGDYIAKVNALAESAVTNGWTASQLTQAIKDLGSGITGWRSRLIARDQMGKLHSKITKAQHQEVGVDCYIWRTANDERVRGRPGGLYPSAKPTHWAMEGKLCKWDDATVYSEDGGKTWIPRPSGAVREHPGMEIQCRCFAEPYWPPVLEVADKAIGVPVPEAVPVQPAVPVSDFSDGAAGYDRLYNANPYVMSYPYGASIDRYTGGWYQGINNSLREERKLDSDSPIPGTIDKLTEFLNGRRIPPELRFSVYRGTTMPNNIKIGDIYHDKGFVSTTTDPEFAKRWIHNRSIQDTGSRNAGIVEVRLKPGDPASIVGNRSEREVLIQRSQNMKLVAIESVDVTTSEGHIRSMPKYVMEIVD